MCCWLLTARAPASADAPAASEQAARLFDEAKQALSEHDYVQACAKLEQSQGLDPQLGTQLHLALCYEKRGLVASAYRTFQAAAIVAAERGDAGSPSPREEFARKHLTKLEPALSSVMLHFAGRPSDELHIELDGRELARDLWHEPLSIDPGEHGLLATAPESQPWKHDFTIGAGAQHLTMEIPELQRVVEAVAEVEVPAPSAVAAELEPSQVVEPPRLSAAGANAHAGLASTQRILSYVTAGAGVAGIGVGVVFGLLRNTRLSQLESYCDLDAGRCMIAAGDTATRDRIDQLRGQAHSAATAATLSFILGGAAVLGGVALLITAPNPRGDLALQIGPGSLTVKGRVNGL
jgi:hypothetical protein